MADSKAQTSSGPIDRFSPLFSRYNGAMLGFFAFTAQLELAKPQYNFIRTRMEQFLHVVGIPMTFPTRHTTYSRQFMELYEHLINALAERAPLVMPWCGLGVGFISSSVSNVGVDDPTHEHWEVVPEILEDHGLPRDLFQTFANGITIDDERGLDFKTVMDPALQFLRKLIEPISVEEDTCFVAMPFARQFVENFPRLYRPLLEANGYRAFRAWGGLTDESYLDLLLQLIAKSGAVLADVTGPNSSVIHEVGVSQGMEKLVILIADSKRYQAPANLEDHAVISYVVEGEDWRERFLDGMGSLMMKAYLEAARPKR